MTTIDSPVVGNGGTVAIQVAYVLCSCGKWVTPPEDVLGTPHVCECGRAWVVKVTVRDETTGRTESE